MPRYVWAPAAELTRPGKVVSLTFPAHGASLNQLATPDDRTRPRFNGASDELEQ